MISDKLHIIDYCNRSSYNRKLDLSNSQLIDFVSKNLSPRHHYEYLMEQRFIDNSKFLYKKCGGHMDLLKCYNKVVNDIGDLVRFNEKCAN